MRFLTALAAARVRAIARGRRHLRTTIARKKARRYAMIFPPCQDAFFDAIFTGHVFFSKRESKFRSHDFCVSFGMHARGHRSHSRQMGLMRAHFCCF